MRKIIAGALAACILCILLTGCASSNTSVSESTSDEFFAMDTVMTMTLYGENRQAALAAAEAEVYRIDNLLSTGNENSEISQLNANGGGTVSDETAGLIAKSKDYCELTGGAFDVTIYPIEAKWGFYSKDYYVPTDSEIEGLMELVGSNKLILDGNSVGFSQNGMAIDLGGIAKGYTSDRLREICEEYGIASAIISLGGNVYAVGSKPGGDPWRVAIQDPDDMSSYIGVLQLTDMAAITSGGYQRYFEEDGVTYQHIIDPSTGKPADSGLSSVTIVAQDGTMADALSTALYVMGKDKALEYWREHSSDFDAVFITDDREITVTAGIKDIFSTVDGSQFEVAQP